MEWRRLYGIDTLLEDFEPGEVLQKYYPAGKVGVDKAHNPGKFDFVCIWLNKSWQIGSILVWIVRYGRIDMRGILRSVKTKDYFNYVLFLIETDIKSLIDSSKVISQSNIIFDLEHFSMRQLSFKPGNYLVHNVLVGYVLYTVLGSNRLRIWTSILIDIIETFFYDTEILIINCVYIALEVAIKIIQCYEANYPEFLHRIFIINGKYNARSTRHFHLSVV